MARGFLCPARAVPRMGVWMGLLATKLFGAATRWR